MLQRHLERAVSALGRDDVLTGLDELLAAWRLNPSTELRQRVLRLSEVVVADLPALTSLEEHLDVGGRKRAMDVPRLLAGLDRATVKEMVERARMLDPWGEFINLQCLDKPDGKQKKRMRELEKAHRLDWVAPLDAVLKPTSIRFRNGFLDAGIAAFKTDGQRRDLLGHPRWATVRELEANDDAVLTHPVMRSLIRANLTPAALATLADADRAVLLTTVIGTTFSDYGLWMRDGIDTERPAEWGDALDVGALTSLRAMSVHVWRDGRYWQDGSYITRRGSPTAQHLRWLWDSPLGEQLEVLDIHGGGHLLGGWWWVLEQRPRLQRVLLRFTNDNTASGSGQVLAIFCLQRDGLTLQMNNGDLQYRTMRKQIRKTLEGFPLDAMSKVDLQYIGSKKWVAGGLDSVAEVLDDVGFTEITLPEGKSVALAV